MITADKIPMLVFEIVVGLSILLAWIGAVLRFAFGLPVLPPWTPRSVPWGIGSVLLAILLWFGIQIFVPGIYYVIKHPKPPGAATPLAKLTDGEHMMLSAVSNAIILAVVPVALFLTAGARRRDFGLVAQGFFRQVFRGVIAYPLLAPMIYGMMILALLIWDKTPHKLEDALKSGQDPAQFAVYILAAVVFAPISEELIFRGVLLGWLTRLAIGRPKPPISHDPLDDPSISSINSFAEEPGFAAELDRDPHNVYAAPRAKLERVELVESDGSGLTSSQITSMILANVVVSLIFAALHSSAWPSPIPIFVLSMGLGMLYQRTGSLIAPMALHMTFNGVSTLLMLLSLGITDAKKEGIKPPDPAAPKIEAKAVAIIIDGPARVRSFEPVPPRQNHSGFVAR